MFQHSKTLRGKSKILQAAKKKHKMHKLKTTYLNDSILSYLAFGGYQTKDKQLQKLPEENTTDNTDQCIIHLGSKSKMFEDIQEFRVHTYKLLTKKMQAKKSNQFTNEPR